LMLLNFLETTQRSFINFAHFDPNFDLWTFSEVFTW
jgi:hypothetical protein